MGFPPVSATKSVKLDTADVVVAEASDGVKVVRLAPNSIETATEDVDIV